MTICADRVRLVVVIGRADADGEVAVETERLWQAYRRRNRLPEKLRVCEDTRAVRIQPGEHGVPAQPSQRELAIRTIEAHTARGKAIDVRRFHERMPVCADVGVQIVGDDEEDVRLPRGCVGGGGCGPCEDQAEEKEGCFHGRFDAVSQVRCPCCS